MPRQRIANQANHSAYIWRRAVAAPSLCRLKLYNAKGSLKSRLPNKKPFGTTPNGFSGCLLRLAIEIAFATRFVQQLHIADNDVVAKRFGHVVHGERGGGGGGERFHFHACFVGYGDFGADV